MEKDTQPSALKRKRLVFTQERNYSKLKPSVDSKDTTNQHAFGHGHLEVVSDPVMHQVVLKVLYHMYDLEIEFGRTAIFPGAQPVSLLRAQIPTLFTDKYWVTEKTNGTRFFLLFTTIDGTQSVFLINRALDIWKVPGLKCTSSMDLFAYEGTLIDGEFVAYRNHPDKFAFLIFDMIAWQGKRLLIPLSKRYSLLNRIMSFSYDVGCPFVILRKPHYPLYCINKLVADMHRKDTPFEVDGLVFTPESVPPLSGTQGNLFKWKPGFANTIDFLCKVNAQEGTAELLVLTSVDTKTGETQMSTVGTYSIENVFGNKFQSSHSSGPECQTISGYENMPVSERASTCNGQVIECRWNEDVKAFAFVGLRADKLLPNNILTWKLTMRNIQENITVEELENKLAGKAY